jgi:phenylacetate-CoA ligase
MRKVVRNSRLLLILRVLGRPARIALRQSRTSFVLTVPALQGILGWVTELTDGCPDALVQLDVELDRSTAGTGQTEQQLQAITELQPEAYTGTPSFLRILVEKAQAEGIDIGSMRKAVVGGEALPPSLRDWFAERGVAVYQSYATADLGLVAYETSAREGLVVDEGVIVEIVRPGTGEPVPEGEVGELVVTTLNPAYPLIRFGTGDLSAILPGACPTGRTAPRIKGWMGRADQTTKVRGMFVHPAQVADIARRFPQVKKARLVVSGEMANDQMCLRVEASEADSGLRQQIEAAVREVTKLRAQVELVQPGSLPNDGKTIEDSRCCA